MAKKVEASKNPVERFAAHQGKALEEAGKALLSLLPKGLREHGANAVTESVEGFKVLGKAAVGEVEKAKNTVVDKVAPKKESPEVEES